MLKNRGGAGRSGEQFSLELFNGLVHQSRPVDTFRAGRPEFIPAVLAVCVLLSVFVFDLRLPETATVNRWVSSHWKNLKWPGAKSPPRSYVLVVTDNVYYEFDVTSTVQPRGYDVYWERTVEQGMTRLQKASGEVKIVVVDGAVAGSGAMIHRIRRAWPRKPVIYLEGPRQPVRLAQSLLNLL